MAQEDDVKTNDLNVNGADEVIAEIDKLYMDILEQTKNDLETGARETDCECESELEGINKLRHELYKMTNEMEYWKCKYESKSLRYEIAKDEIATQHRKHHNLKKEYRRLQKEKNEDRPIFVLDPLSVDKRTRRLAQMVLNSINSDDSSISSLSDSESKQNDTTSQNDATE